jgi:hypothetical protein
LILKLASLFLKSSISLVKNFVLGISPKETIINEMDKIRVIGKNIFKILVGFNPKEVITISSYSLESLPKAMTNAIKNEMGKV